MRTCRDHCGQAQIREDARPAVLFEPVSKSAAVEAQGAPHQVFPATRWCAAAVAAAGKLSGGV